MARNIVKAKLDIIFKKLFTDEGNQHLLQAYLSDSFSPLQINVSVYPNLNHRQLSILKSSKLKD